jgi:transposase
MKDTMIGVDLAKNVFQLHGASKTGHMMFRKKLTREQFRRFMSEQLPCLVVFEACGSANYWAREMKKLGHDAMLIAPQYVRPFVKRQKNDAADAEAEQVQAVLDSLDHAIVPPVVERQGEFQDAVNGLIERAKLGELTAQEALTQAKAEIEALLD